MLSTVYRLGGAVRTGAISLARHRRTPAAVAGFVVGVAGWSAALPFVAAVGFHRTAVAGLLLAVVAFYAVGERLSRRHACTLFEPLAGLVAAAWLVLLPIVMPMVWASLSLLPVTRLAIEAVQVVSLMLVASIAFGIPSLCLGLIASRHARAGNSTIFVAAAGLGVAASALAIAPFIGLVAPLLVIGVGTAIVWFVTLVRGETSFESRPSDEATAREALADGPLQELGSRRWEIARRFVTVALCGMGCAASGRVLAQLMPESAYLLAGGVALFLLGAAGGASLRGQFARCSRRELTARRFGAWLAAMGLLFPLAAFPWLLMRHLDANAYVSSVFWLMMIRLATVAAVVLPLAVGCGLIVFGFVSRRAAAVVTTPDRFGSASPQRRGAECGAAAVAAACGLIMGSWLVPLVGVVPLTLGTAVVLLALNLGRVTGGWPQSRRGWAMVGACATMVAVMGTSASGYAPARSARLLFSTESFIARQAGVPAELLPFLDDTRLVSVTERPAGTVTLWKQRGEACVVRVNGIPVAATSRRPDLCPMPSADVMRIVLPLVLHQKPGSVLILGDPTGVATELAAGFPVREIVCYDANGASLAPGFASVPSDDRVKAATIEPRLALAAERRRFDVVVSEPGVPSLLAATPYFTQEFYAAAAARLTEGGLFCQRLRYVDYGPEPLRVIAATMTRVFGDVMTIEIGSGEYALLAARPGQSVVRSGLADRLQRPHVRRTLATLGWDWCVPLNLVTVEQEGLALLAAEAKRLNTEANGWFAYTLPRETMRWGVKWQELQQATTGRTSRLLARAVLPEDQADVVARIAEFTGQHELMTRYPDQPWAYRKEVRAKLKEPSRTVIQKVSGELRRTWHPEERRRLDYLDALGAAIREATPETLAALERFAEPYDPLVTYFLHHEIAPLYAMLGEAGAAGEFVHRLYAAHYADPRDRSVRNVAATLELLVEHPGVVPDDADRFDHFSALIEVLLGRWEARGMAEPRSPEIVMVDIEKSLDATEKAMAAMEPLAAAAGLSNDDWRCRKAAIERTLTRPLRKYRTTLLPHLRQAQRSGTE
jgi:hypothetical protein